MLEEEFAGGDDGMTDPAAGESRKPNSGELVVFGFEPELGMP